MKKPIKDYPGYYIYTDGRVWSDKSNQFLKPYNNGSGYLYVQLYDGHNSSTHCYIHRLVAEAFIPNPNNLPEINHLDENRTNNTINNLEWCEHVDNINYGTRTRKASKPLGQYDKKTNQLIRMYQSGVEACRINNWKCSNAISACAKGKTKSSYGYKWKYISQEEYEKWLN